MTAPTVSAIYVVKNEEEYLPFSVRSVCDAVGEVIIVDNESTDRTVERVRSIPGVRLFSSGARDLSDLWNSALSRATGKWVLVVGADEVYYPAIADQLPHLIADPAADGYWCWFYHLMRSYYYMQNRTEFDPIYRRITILRKTPTLHYERAVHERIAGLGPNIIDTRLQFVHYGYAKPCEDILRRWKLYARLEGVPDMYDRTDPVHMLDDRPIWPFRREHPAVIREYVEATAAARALKGEKLFRKLPPDPEDEPDPK